ncbi:MAG TPA: hypothetical protein VMC84_05980 [Methanocella sp.]|uniref:hypothetical protein n=1 Tax=Methanocella sp. TaxID=2052833 RepID=UPI002BEC5E78|nr:hypothetical protein [Methanocella sp.]HTY90710.1 hypothetical protein [Methanocella sp.]
MSRRMMNIAIAILTITIALMLFQANASLVPEPFGFGCNSNNQASQANPYPAPTQEQKEEAIKIAATSPVCKQYNAYPDASWSVGWSGFPPDGHTLDVFKEISTNYFLTIWVDLDTGSVVKTDYSQGWGEYGTDALKKGASSITPFQSGSLTSFPASMSISQPLSMFSSGLAAGNSKAVNTPLTTSTSALGSNLLANMLSTPMGSSSWTSVFPDGPSANFRAATNAPAITQQQKDEAMKIASTADFYRTYSQYPNDGWQVKWKSPYDGHTVLVTTNVGSALSSDPNAPRGEVSITVDLNTGHPVSDAYHDDKTGLTTM